MCITLPRSLSKKNIRVHFLRTAHHLFGTQIMFYQLNSVKKPPRRTVTVNFPAKLSGDYCHVTSILALNLAGKLRSRDQVLRPRVT